MALKVKKFDLSKMKNVDIQSFKIREICGNDVMKAAVRCVSPDGKPLEGALFGMNLRQQQVAMAIVEVNDKPVIGPVCIDYFEWNTRTQWFIAKAYDSLNMTSDDEDEDFKKQLVTEDAGQSATSL